MFLTNVEICWSMFNNNVIRYIHGVYVYYEWKEYMYFKKNNFSSNEAIKFYGSRRFWWVGRKGETIKILF
jgi:hypothetical protein